MALLVSRLAALPVAVLLSSREIWVECGDDRVRGGPEDEGAREGGGLRSEWALFVVGRFHMQTHCPSSGSSYETCFFFGSPLNRTEEWPSDAAQHMWNTQHPRIAIAITPAKTMTPSRWGPANVYPSKPNIAQSDLHG